MSSNPDAWRRATDIALAWGGQALGWSQRAERVAPVTDPEGRTLPFFFDLYGGAVRQRVLVAGEFAIAPDDPGGLAAWARSQGAWLRAAPSPHLLTELLGYFNLLPEVFWRGPYWDLRRLDGRFRPAPDTPFSTVVEYNRVRLLIPFERHDGGGLLGHRSGVMGPGGGAASQWRLVVELRFDGRVQLTEEVLAWDGGGRAWAPLHLRDGSEAVPVPLTEADIEVAEEDDDGERPQPYATSAEHLEGWAERVRLLILRHLRRFWFRVTDGTGHLSDTFVSLDELRVVFGEEEDRSSALRELPSLEELEAQLAAHRVQMEARCAASLEGGVALPIEDLRAILAIDDEGLDALMAVAVGQVRIDLHRAMRRAWADFTSAQPSLGFLAEFAAGTREQERALLQLGQVDHPVRRLGVLRFGADPEWREGTPLARLRVVMPDRVVAFLQGQRGASLHAFEDTPGGLTFRVELVRASPPDANERLPAELPRALTHALRGAHRLTREGSGDWRVASTTPTVLLHGPDPSVMRDLVAAAADEVGAILVADWSRIDLSVSGARIDEALTAVLREARLEQAGLALLLGEQAEQDAQASRLLSALQRVLPAARGVLLLGLARPWGELRRLLGPCPELHVPLPDPVQRLALWRRALAAELRQTPALETSVRDLATRYALPAHAIQDAVRAASVARAQNPGDLTWALQSAVREQITHKLGALAERFSTSLTWEDLVLPGKLKDRLREMLDYARNERRVYDAWGFGRLHSYGRGLTALFAGPPGTGKTLAAAIMARELGAELYRVNLSRVVDKYIGETEKNLARIFDEAERGRAILLFDEADSLFAKRTAVKSSNDRYANQEVNFLLQRMEHFDGTSILTTNARDALDDAFQRRIKFRLEFDLPDEAERLRIWRSMIPAAAPTAADIDWKVLARDFEMAPAHIKNAALRAAFRAAQDNTTIHHKLLYESAQIEYRELGNLVKS